MEQRRKIIIPTGSEEPLSTPHFDAEATLLARPVVPLAEPVTLPAQDTYANARGGVAPPEAASSWKRSTWGLIVLAAVGVGVVSGLAIGSYQNRTKTAQAPVGLQQPTVKETLKQTVPPLPEPMPAPRVQLPEEAEQVAEVQPPEPRPAREAAAVVADRETKDNDADERRSNNRQATRGNPNREAERVLPAIGRNRRVTEPEPEIDERDERRERKEQRREERRAERRRQRQESDDDNPVSAPRSVERARQQINRIRDIFEGSRP